MQRPVPINDILDKVVGDWIGARTSAEVIAAVEAAEAAVAPIYDVADVMAYQALGSLVAAPDPDLGPLVMQNVLFRLSETPGAIETTGPRLGEHNAEVLELLGIDVQQRDALAWAGVI